MGKIQAKTDTQVAEFFESKIRPLLSTKCTGCHGATKQAGGLRLDTPAATKAGGVSGLAITPGNPDSSLLIQAVRYDGKLKMPPGGKLNPDEIAALTEWVKAGAVWPAAKVSIAAQKYTQNGDYVITDEQRSFWSFKPITNPKVPKVKNAAWCKTQVDKFILSKLEEKGYAPNKVADRYTLIRRATLDLTGLPPTFEETKAFVSDTATNAYENLLDRLLASPRYGERWGRIWLDVARFADTKGYVFEEDRVYHNAYTYRDYVIRAMNSDLPYDRFIKEQLAADMMDLGEDKRPLAALGFLTLGRRFLNSQPDIIDDRIDVTMRGFEGLTVNCARCHDHKFDPIPAKDYYSLYGVFASAHEPSPGPPISDRSISEPYVKYETDLNNRQARYDQIMKNEIRRLRGLTEAPGFDAKLKTTLQALRIDQLPKDNNQQNIVFQAFEPAAKKEYTDLKKAMDDMKKSEPQKPEFAMTLAENKSPFDPYVFLRGNPGNRGPSTPRQFLAVLSGPERKPFSIGGGRLELAEAIGSKTNPLTARVMMNRLWRYHFTVGLVRTPGDFGTRGDPPTNPELLDYLSTQFMEQGWSIKKMQKLIMMSSVYKQASTIRQQMALADPENKLLWKQNRRRMDLEQTRDSAIFASGGLDEKVGGPSVEITTKPYSMRRTLYGFIDRQNLQGLFRTFDFASPDTTSAQRFSTTVPQQTLFVMNSPFEIELVKRLASRPEFNACSANAQRVSTAYRIIFGRDPNASEISIGDHFLSEQISSSDDSAKEKLSTWERYIQALLMTNEFTFID